MSDQDQTELDPKTVRFFCAEFRKFLDGIEAMVEEKQEEPEVEEEVLSF